VTVSFIHAIVGPIARWIITGMSRRRLPQTGGSVTLPGLSGGSVEVIRDKWGVPHIYADDPHDLFFAQGFVHAQDRLWQMELSRRTALGRLSELFGEIALDTDRASRTFGFNRLGQADYEGASDAVRSILEAYAAGVNGFLDCPTAKLPVEFALIKHRPEPWRPEDSLAFTRVMIWQLSHAWYDEIVRSRVADTVGAARAAELEIHYPKLNPSTLPDGAIEFNRIGPEGSLVSAEGPFLNRGIGSNVWAIAPGRSETGAAFLCNDMHLALGLPGIWYQAHLAGGGFDVTGASLAGVPLVLVGHNARIAWGMTLAYTDCEDLYVEQFDPDNPRRYRFGDQWLDAEVISEPIRVKDRGEPHVEEVVVTRHGPVISDVVGYPAQRLAVCSMALRPCPAIEGWLRLNRAGGWDDFVESMRLIEAPQLSVGYADTDGNVGYWCTGKVPVRAKGDGTLPAPGWTGEHEWIDEVPFEQMPHLLNPERGYLVNCNNRIVTDDYPHFLGSCWMNGFRARRIEELLAAKPTLSAEDFKAIQLDVTCLPGKELVRRLEGLQSEEADVQLALEHLRAWDGVLAPESVGGTLYEVARYTMVRTILEPALGEELTSRVMGQGFHPLLKACNVFYGHDTTTLLRLLDNPDSWWVQQAGGREQVLEQGLKRAVQWLRAELGRDPSSWRWGRLHRAIFGHPMGMQKPLDRVFNRGPVPVGGDTDTPCQTGMLAEDPYDPKAWGPGFRQIVDMGDLSRSLIITVPGQSGHLASPHYDDAIDPWLKGEYQPMLWTREQVEQAAESRLVLEPQ
jgi:penicillin amidase